MTASTTENVAQLRVSDSALLGPILSRVLGMLAARAQCPIDRLDDALLVADAIAAHSPRYARDNVTQVELRAAQGRLELTVDGLEEAGGRHLLRDAELPGVGNVLERVADEVSVDAGQSGGSLHVRLLFPA